MIEELLIENLINDNRRALARSISIVEEGGTKGDKLLKGIISKLGHAYRIGVTGPPGAGKSTITNQLTKIHLNENKKVGIIAVDPTSPFTGGALLGDRIRMNEIGQNKNVFIRSMASRGSLGGLSKKAIDAADVLDAAGFDLIILETVGVGQSELDIAKASDTTVVVVVPESGDSIQAMKAGLMEIADIFVLNKSDRPGANQSETALKTIISLKDHDENSWLPSIIRTVASENEGIIDLTNEIERHRKYLNEKDRLAVKRKDQLKNRIKNIVQEKIDNEIWNKENENSLKLSLKNVIFGNVSPYEIAEEIIKNYKKNK
jgi:GTPase